MPKIRVGDHAPEFVATTHNGESVRLSSCLGKKALVLFFYPKDGTSVCTKEACSFRDSYEQFVDAGAEVIGISSDSDERHQAFVQQHRLPFPLVSDSDGTLRQLFGVSKTLGIMPGRVTYVIDRTGVVRLLFRAQFASAEHVRLALEAVRENE